MVKSDTRAPYFQRLYDLNAVPRSGLEDRIEATSSERATMAEALDLPALDRLAFSYQLKPLARHRFRLKGQVEASATQNCVVTLAPLPVEFAQQVDMELWPADQITDPSGRAPGTEIEVSLDGPEPYNGDEIDLGQLAYEVFASALEPYPRKPDAEFVWTETSGSKEEGEESPFAVLRNLKRP